MAFSKLWFETNGYMTKHFFPGGSRVKLKPRYTNSSCAAEHGDNNNYYALSENWEVTLCHTSLEQQQFCGNQA